MPTETPTRRRADNGTVAPDPSSINHRSPDQPTPRTVSVEHAAVILGISRAHAYTLARQGLFPCAVRRIGRRIVVPRDALDRYLTEGE